MRKNRIIKGIVSGLIALGCAANAMPVHASNTYTAVRGGQVQFEKYLVYDSTALPVDATFSFTLTSSGNAIAASGSDIAVYSGDDSSIQVIDNTKDAVTVGTAVFTNATTKYTTVQNLDASVNLGEHATLTQDPVDLTKDQSGQTLPTGKTNAYSRVPVTIDFTNVNFTEPGVYRWKINENANADAAAIGVTIDSADHFIDVYVDSTGFTPSNTAGAGNGTLAIVGYVFHTDSSFQPTSLTTAEEPTNGKAKGFTNFYETHSLTISKNVSGNQAAHDKYFKFTISLDNAGASNKIVATGSFDRTTANETTNTRTKAEYKNQTQPTEIVTNSTGTVTQVYYLEHNQSVTLQGIPHNALVTIIEDEEDYSPHYTYIDKDNALDAIDKMMLDANVAEDEINIAMFTILGDMEFDFVNTKAGTIPTGIVNAVIPGVAIVLLGIAGVVIISQRKKAEE